MSIQAAYVVPHPPLIIPSVGRGEERGIQKTIDAYKEIARRVVAHRPETIIVSSPHAPLYRDGFHITTDTLLSGSMESFRAPQTKIEVDIDVALTQSIIQEATRSALDIVPSSWRDHEMDHATFIPLYFIAQSYKEAGVVPNFRVVRVGLSGLSADVHRQFGHVLSNAVDATKRRCVYIASGDLSHKLKTDGPYGFAPEGPKLDHRLCELFQSGALEDLFELDEDFCDRAAECGVRSFQIMAGVLEMQSLETIASHWLQSPSFGLYSVELLASVVAAASMGTEVLASYQVVNAAWNFTVNALDSIAIAGQTLVGAELGARAYGRARVLTKDTARAGFVVGCVVGLLFALIGLGAGQLFSPNPSIQLLVAGGMVAVGIMMPLQGWMWALDGILIGAGDFRYLALSCTASAIVHIGALGILVFCINPYLPNDLTRIVVLWLVMGVFLMGGRGVANGLRARCDTWMKNAVL